MKDSLQEASALNARLTELVQISHRIRRQALFHRHIVDCPDCMSGHQPGCASALTLLHDIPASVHAAAATDRMQSPRENAIYNHDFRQRFSWGLAVAVGMAGVLELLDKAGLLSMPQ